MSTPPVIEHVRVGLGNCQGWLYGGASSRGKVFVVTVKFTLAVTGVDVDDFDLLDRLVEALPHVHWGEVDGQVQADVYMPDMSVVHAVQQVTDALRAIVPTAGATRLLEDFVAVPDIAKRCDVNRETVRLWSKEATFPVPRSVVGNGIKVWDWASVNSWLRHEHAGALGDPYRHPTAAEIAQANTLLRQVEVHHLALEAELQLRPRPSGHRWEQIPTVGSPGTSVLRMGAGRRVSAASFEAVAG